ncbi:MAG: type II toxin-antitoxin system Phd/YefM family antitoxin [Gammaproteobacteria bacterium]|nr:type II toxin-antitoxin system Phd/YefM family antitoxin [Gammaproteobacteria bacterium]
MTLPAEQMSLTDIQTSLARVIQRAAASHKPIMLTESGRGVAVVQALSDYERAEADRKFMRAIVQGVADIDTGREISLADAKSRLSLK